MNFLGSPKKLTKMLGVVALQLSAQWGADQLQKNHAGDVIFLHSVHLPNGTDLLHQDPEAFLWLLQQMDSCTPMLTAGIEQLCCHGLGSLLSSDFALKTSVKLGSLPVIYLQTPKLIRPKVVPVTERQKPI